MPPARVTTRQMSRQLSPYVQPQAQPGPSHPVQEAIILSEDEGPARKKRAVNARSSKRTNNKARAPPPSAEVIEISSDDDDDEVPQRRPAAQKTDNRTKALEEEVKRLKEELATANARVKEVPTVVKPPKLLAEEEAPFARGQVLSTFEDHVSCEICTLKMWQPYTLSCGHTFCKTCLQDWFSQSLGKHLASHPNYDAQRLGTTCISLLAALRQPHVHQHTKRDFEHRIVGMLLDTGHPEYSCPTCRVLIKTRPAENFVVKHMVRTIAGLQGEACPLPPPPPSLPGKPVEGPFDAFFPRTVQIS